MREDLERIPESAREAFKAAHLAEVKPFMTGQGLWLDVETHVAVGTKP